MARPSFMRNVSTRVVALSALAVATIAVPASLLAWGPERPTYTVANPAPHVTFNSITDNKNIGDERNFVGIRENGTTGKWQDNQTVTPGKEYVVRLYVHNNAAENLKLVANNVTAKVNLPTTTAKSIEVQGFVNASNATPKEVYDHATFSGAENFNLAVVPGSLKYYNNANGNGFTIPETLFTSTGAKLGYDKMDGNIPGCFQYAGYLTFIVKPQFAAKQDFTMNKLVSKHGENKWVDNYAAKPGETVDYLLEYKNTGEAQQDNVTFRDTLPADQSYVAGSTVFGNSKNPNGVKASDNVTGNGVNVGSYAAGANAWMIFSAKVATNNDLDKCGPNTMTNTASVTTAYGKKSDTAVVTVTKECAPVTPTPANPAVSIEKMVRSGASTDGMTKAQALEEAKNYRPKGNCTTVMTPAVHVETGARYTFTSGCLPEGWVREDRASATSTTTESTSTTAGWTEHAVVSPDADFQYRLVVKNTGDVTLKDVKVTDQAPAGVTFKSADKGTITNNVWNYTVSELKAGQSVTVVITARVAKSNVPANETIKNTACVDAPLITGEKDDCDDATVEVKTPVITPTEPETPVTPDTPEAPEAPVVTPETPAELPQTGIADGLMSVLGLSSMVAASSYYRASRKSLQN